MTKFSEEQIKSLKAPLNGSHVKQREQAGRKFNYVEGWHAIAECNRIFGFDAWDRETVELRQLGDPREVDGKWRVGYMARVRISVRGDGPPIVRDGCGYGSGIDRDVGQAHESALKEAETDAMKRALMTFGNPFGLALYDKEQKEVEGGPVQKAAPKPAPKPAPIAPTWPTFARIGLWVDWSKAELPKMDEARARAWEEHFRPWMKKLAESTDAAQVDARTDLLNLYNEALGRKKAA